MSNEYKEPEDLNNISEDLLSLAGIWQVLKNLNVGQKFVIHFKNGQKISGKKHHFDDESGIISLQSEFDVPVMSTIETEKPQLEKKELKFSGTRIILEPYNMLIIWN